MLKDFLSHTPNTVSTQIPHYQQLLNELSATTQKANNRGTFQVVSKTDIIEKIGHSPDYADAAALSLYFERYTATWQKPVEELTTADIHGMSNKEILDAYAEYYE